MHCVSSLSRTWSRCLGPFAFHSFASVCGSSARSVEESRTQSSRVEVVNHSSASSGSALSSDATIAGTPVSAQCAASSR